MGQSAQGLVGPGKTLGFTQLGGSPPSVLIGALCGEQCREQVRSRETQAKELNRSKEGAGGQDDYNSNRQLTMTCIYCVPGCRVYMT